MAAEEQQQQQQQAAAPEGTSSDQQREQLPGSGSRKTTMVWTSVKLLASAALAFGAYSHHHTGGQRGGFSFSYAEASSPDRHAAGVEELEDGFDAGTGESPQHRRLEGLQSLGNKASTEDIPGNFAEQLPSYMKELREDLASRKKLFDETPPEEVKYWFEYTGPLQVSVSEAEEASQLASSSYC